MSLETPVLNAWQQPPREMHNHSMDSTRWHGFRFRDQDIVIVTWAKVGTTWLQQILGQLIFGAGTRQPVADLSPWIEYRCAPLRQLYEQLEAQRHRRFVKTHLPADALVFSPRARYLYIGRDGRDVLWSWYNHHRGLTPIVYEMLEGTPGLVGPPLEPPGEDVRQYFLDWLARDGYPLWPFWSHVQSWWDLRARPNVLLLHFMDLKADLAGQIRRVAHFLDIPLDESSLPRICELCSFQYMKANAALLAPQLNTALRGGARKFLNRGESGHWRHALTAADIADYERRMSQNLGPDCAAWLTHGTLTLPGGGASGRDAGRSAAQGAAQ